MVSRPTRRVYSAEELHRLRGTTSQPKLCEAIEEHDGDDAELVKEHVLRGSKSFAARSWRSRKSASTSLHVPFNNENRSTNVSDNDRPAAPLTTKVVPVLGEIASNNQVLRPVAAALKPGSSPTHSIRRKKIESLVQAHGSPDHVRVTAGGRIVPSEQSPLCHPRYGYSAMKSNGGLIKFAPNHPLGKAQWTPATQNGFVAQDINGRLCQIVDGTILPLHETAEGLRLYIPAPNLNITVGPQSVVGRPSAGPTRVLSGNNEPPVSRVFSEPTAASQINALEIEYVKLEHELKDVDKTEVLHGRTIGKGAKDALISKRRELIVNLDKIRRALKSLRDQTAPMPPTSPRAMMYNKQQQGMSPPRNRLPAFLQQRQHNQQMMLPGPPGPPVFGPYYGNPQPAQYGAPYEYGSTPSPESAFSMQPWAMPPPAMFAPTFDGALSTPSLQYRPEAFPAASTVAYTPASTAVELPTSAQRTTTSLAPAEGRLRQIDGSRSFADPPRVTSPSHSRALSIKAPEPKPATKSMLNPMSPVYKPGAGLLQSEPDRPTPKSVKDRAPTPLSPLHQLKARASSLKRGNMDGTNDSPTTTKHNTNSSSVSSFQTADFFPQNTRDFSTSKYAKSPQSAQSITSGAKTSGAKENMSPITPAKDVMPLTHGHPTPAAPVAPPVTPVEGVPDRSAHNMSPKNKWLAPSVQDTNATESESKKFADLPDLPQAAGKSREWLAGYYAALAANAQSHPIEHRLADPHAMPPAHAEPQGLKRNELDEVDNRNELNERMKRIEINEGNDRKRPDVNIDDNDRSPMSRMPSPCRSVVSSIGSRPGRIFSGLFAQIERQSTSNPLYSPTLSREDVTSQHNGLDGMLKTDNIQATSPKQQHASPDEKLGDVDGDQPKSNKNSPTRAKFEKIAESVGIKVDGLSPTKRRWRDVWRGSGSKN
ncbi:hypothetical protein LTR97_007983 [Elasticomyces elasticus]|uniref:Uncharacterized protein n=1 Tax=Elasticomyces elasticus TaxID=574655 RepID=A0AAN8A0L0_9PEZI|nr:hypothetical protein LTR97_007983 [Elasticomyces elasticus]